MKGEAKVTINRFRLESSGIPGYHFKESPIDVPTTTWNPGAAPRILPLVRADVPADTVTLARFLLGKVLVRRLAEGTCLGRIVETEAYVENDPACHAYRGITARNRSLFLGVGHAYVYLCYGTSYMLNVSSGREGVGTGVLIRALEPLAGIEHMRRSRGPLRLIDLNRGPGRLTSAFSIDRRDDGVDLLEPGTLWIGGDGTAPPRIATSVRIGLTKGIEAPLRFFAAGSPFVSGSARLNAPRN